MTEWDSSRVALVVARSSESSDEGIATGYFLTANLVLTVRHVADEVTGDVKYRVRTEVGGSEKDKWTSAHRVWVGLGIDALLLRTDNSFESWTVPEFLPETTSGAWISSGYARVATTDQDRKTLPIKGLFHVSKGQGQPELSLTINQVIQQGETEKWKVISGSPIFLDAMEDGLVGLITEVQADMTNVLVALPIERLLEDIHFRTAIHPISFLGQLPERPWCLVVSGAGTPHNLRNKVAGALNKCRLTASDFGDPIPIELNVLEATSSPENWAASIEALAKAKFVVADVTNSEPAIMVLLGVRSVLRRGVTVSVSSGGAASIETAKPFNVRETRVLSSSHSDFIDRLSKVLVDGAIGLDADPNYLDLPAFLAARAPRPFDWANEDLRTILVLCPFAGPYSTLYDDELRSVINSWSGKDPVRMLDLRSPRLVGQSLYEQIRWSTHCLVDLSGWHPDVCFELGVRLACSDHEPLVIIQAPENNSPDAVGSEPPTEAGASQEAYLLRLLAPVVYDASEVWGGGLKNAIVNWINGVRPDSWNENRLPASSTFAVAQRHFYWLQESDLLSPDREQRIAAERMFGDDRERTPERHVLFSANPSFDEALTAAVQEKWISAWLYLRHRLESGDTSEGLRTEFRIVSRHLDSALISSDNARHVSLRALARSMRNLGANVNGKGEAQGD